MFSKKLKELRGCLNISQAELARRLGMSQQAIAKWETEKATPDPEMLGKIADYFNVSTDYLLGRTSTRRQITTEAAHRSDNPMDDLPQEAIDKIEEFKELMRMKYGKKSSK